jgi:cytoskeletal protein CcmA (bactofilin family)
MPFVPRKAPFRCPHCGFVQEEPEHLISTYCRRCGSHYEAAATSPNRTLFGGFQRAVRQSGKRPSLLPGRTVLCHRCGKSHKVSRHARTTLCPFCNTAIDLCDVTISSTTSRPIDTRGNLFITPSGYVCSALTVCRGAHIAGRISGMLVCEATLRITCSERLSCQVSAASLVIEEPARLELTSPIRSGDLTVYGRAIGNFECAGQILIVRGGVLEGRISASSLKIEPGATLLAECFIHPVPKKASIEQEKDAGVFAPTVRPLPAY